MIRRVTAAIEALEDVNEQYGRTGIYSREVEKGKSTGTVDTQLSVRLLDNLYEALKQFDTVIKDAVNIHGLGSALDETLTTQEVGEKLINEVRTENKKKIYAIKGLKDYLVIDMEDALLICPRDDKQFREFISGLGMPGYEDFR